MRVIYQCLTKTLSYGSTLVDKPKALPMALTGVAAINIDGTTIHTAFNIPVGHFGSNLPPLSDKMKSSLRNRLSELKIIIIDEISMLSNNLLICLALLIIIHLQVYQLLLLVIFFNFHELEKGLYIQIRKITGKILNHYGNSLKFLN